MRRLFMLLLALGLLIPGCTMDSSRNGASGDSGSSSGAPDTPSAPDGPQLSGKWQLTTTKTYDTHGKVPDTSNHGIDITQVGMTISFTMANGAVATGTIADPAVAFQWALPCTGTCSESYIGTLAPGNASMSGTWSGFDGYDKIGGTWMANKRN